MQLLLDSLNGIVRDLASPRSIEADYIFSSSGLAVLRYTISLIAKGHERSRSLTRVRIASGESKCFRNDDPEDVRVPQHIVVGRKRMMRFKTHSEEAKANQR